MIKLDYFCLVTETKKSTPQLNLNVVLATPILVFRPQSHVAFTNHRLIFHLGDIHIENSESHSSNYVININDLHLFSIDLEQEFRHNQGTDIMRMYKNPHKPVPILDNISINLNVNVTDTSTTVNSKLVSAVQMFLGKHQITLLQNIIGSITYNEYDQQRERQALNGKTPDDESLLLLFDDDETTSSSNENVSKKKFNTIALHLHLPKLIIAFQADLGLTPTKVCEAIFSHFQMSVEQRDPLSKNISLHLNSIHINDHLVKVNECLFSTRCRRNSSLSFTFDEQKLSSSFPINNNHQRDPFSSSSVPTYMVTNDTSTWTLSSSPSTSITTPSSALPTTFIDINITLMDKRHENFDGFIIKADAQFGEVNIEFIISTWVMLLDIIGLIGGASSPALKGN